MPRRPDGTYDYGEQDTSNPIFQLREAEEERQRLNKTTSIKWWNVAQAEPIKYRRPYLDQSQHDRSRTGIGRDATIFAGVVIAIFIYACIHEFSRMSIFH